MAIHKSDHNIRMQYQPLVDRIDAILPQTQCQRCNYTGCRPYAEAIANGHADINQCPPGGGQGIIALAELLKTSPKPLNPEHGEQKTRCVATIVEEDCIGCVKCILACPVDAILGAAKQMHTVIESECTGCELCIAPCPMDCIRMEPIDLKIDPIQSPYYSAAANVARTRYTARIQRLERDKKERTHRLQQKKDALKKR